MSEPMADKRLSEIRGRFAWQRIDQSMEVTCAFRELLTEVERLKAREVELVADIHLVGDLAIKLTQYIDNADIAVDAAGFVRQIKERL